MEIKAIAESVGAIGAGNTALILIMGMFAWYFTQSLPKTFERLIDSIDKLGDKFTSHDDKATSIQNTVIITKSDLAIAKTEIITAIKDHAVDCERRSTQLQRDVLHP